MRILGTTHSDQNEKPRSNTLLLKSAPQLHFNGAQAEGTYFEGVSEVAGSRISLARPAVPIWEDPFTKLATLRTDLTIDRGMSFEVR